MKLIANSLRIVTGLLFVFSGFIKINDPTGFSIKLEEYFIVFASDLAPKPDTLNITIKNKETSLNEIFTRLLRNEKEKNITFRTQAWQHIEIKDDRGANISFYDKTTLNVLLDGQELFKQDIQKKDAAPANFEVSMRIGEKVIYSKNISLYNNQNIFINEKINLESYIKKESGLAKFVKALNPYAMILAILICAFEILLGIALLIGWKRNLTLWLLAAMLLFFSFLTWYSAYYNKVTDCGCFGNAIPLTPWQSFIKDAVLCSFVLILIVVRKHIKPVFSSNFSWKMLLVFTFLSLGFAFYCWYYLPIFNFLKFANGNDIEILSTLSPDAKQEKREMIFIYTKDGKDFEFSSDQLLDKKILENPAYTFKVRIDKILEEGDKPEIHDFAMADEFGQDHVKAFLEKDEYKLLMVSQSLTSARPRAMKKISKLANEWTTKTKFSFWALTSTSPSDAEALRHEYQLPFKFYYGDQTNLKSIIRSNPGLILFKKGSVIASWPSTDLPSHRELIRKMKKNL